MGFFTFFMSFVIGVNIYILLKTLFNKDITRLITITILTIVMVTYTIPLLLQYETKDYTLDETYTNSVLEDPYNNHMRINRDYLPVKALILQRTYLKEKEYRTYVLQGECKIENEEIKDLSITATIKDCEEGTILEFPFFYYPGYRVILEENGEKTKLESIESENGFVSTVMNKDIREAKITVEYKGTLITYASYAISFITLIIFVIYIIKQRKKTD